VEEPLVQLVQDSRMGALNIGGALARPRGAP
jgi:hypothetical protein